MPYEAEGRWIGPESGALVARADGTFGLLLPDVTDDHPAAPVLEILIAVAVLTDDPEWVQMTLERFAARVSLPGND